MAVAAPLIVVCANRAWNLVHFRSGLIRSLREHGFDVLAVAPPEPDMERRLAELGCRFEPVPFDPMGLTPFRDIRSFAALLRLLRDKRPKAWLSWTIKPNVYGSLAASLAGVAAFPNVSGLGTAFMQAGMLNRLVRALYRVGFRGTRSVFFQNDEDRALFVGQKLVDPARARLLPGSGIDLEHFAPLDDARPARRRFLMIARVVADKGIREYVEAARRIRRSWPDARFELMGPLDVPNRTAIGADEVRSWDAEGVIRYLPPAGDVRPAIAKADFVVLPSYREGLARVLLEAAAMARPIVTTDVPGCRHVVTEGVNGYLCAPRDAAALAEALERAARTEDADWHRMAASGRALVSERFSEQQVIDAYLEALSDTGIAPPGALPRKPSS